MRKKSFRKSENPSSLRYFRANGQANKTEQISEAIFRGNALYPTQLTPFFFVGIFVVLRIGAVYFGNQYHSSTSGRVFT